MRLSSLGNFIGRVSDSRRHIALAALLFLLGFGLIDFIAELLMVAAGVDERLHAATQATFVGLVAAITVYLLLRARGERRRVINDELERVIELNHSLRNALEIIAHSHYVTSEEVRKTMLIETAQKMSDKLTELFPTVYPDRRKHQKSARILEHRARSAEVSNPDEGQRLA